MTEIQRISDLMNKHGMTLREAQEYIAEGDELLSQQEEMELEWDRHYHDNGTLDDPMERD